MTVTEERRSLFRDLFDDGRAEGRQEGRAEGLAEGEARSVLAVLQARGFEVSEALRATVMACTDAATLDRWLHRAASMPEGENLLAEPDDH